MKLLDLGEPKHPWGEARYRWAPIMLRPIIGSDERFVVGALVSDGTKTSLVEANALNRLKCLYGDSAEVTQIVATAAMSMVRDIISEPSFDIDRLGQINAHVEVGEWREAEGKSTEEVAKRWLSISSSFHEVQESRFELRHVVQQVGAPQQDRVGRRVKLRADVFDFVAKQRPIVAGSFSVAVQRKASVRRKLGAISIDFEGQALTANIEDMGGSQPWRTISNIKERLWDLSVARDRRRHDDSHVFEMLVCTEASSIEPEQQAELTAEFTEQADREELRLRKFETAGEVGKHILELEAA